MTRWTLPVFGRSYHFRLSGLPSLAAKLEPSREMVGRLTLLTTKTSDLLSTCPRFDCRNDKLHSND